MAKAAPDQWSHDFHHVLEEELRALGAIRKDASPENVIKEAHKARLAGLAFSGGGIRSATFNLGVLQALADLKLLGKFDYLSTVSGGGYIGSWLVAWIHRRGGNLAEVSSGLGTSWAGQISGGDPEEIHFLRRFSNYLTPKLGWLGADTWTVVAIYLRNVILNMVVLIAALAFVLMLPRALGALVAAPLFWTIWSVPVSVVVFALLLTLAGSLICWNLISLQRRQRDIWSGEPLNPDNRAVKQLMPPVSADGVFEPSREMFSDFVLDLHFTRKDATSSSDILVRMVDDPKAPPGWEITIDEDLTARAEEKEATGQQLKPPQSEPPERLRISCVGSNCSVQLNGGTVKVFPSRRVPLTGRIEVRHQADNNGVTVHSLLVRPLQRSRLLSRQGWVQRLIVLPLLLAGLISLRWLGQPQTLSSFLGIQGDRAIWFDQRRWVLWAVVAAAVMVFAHAVQLCLGFGGWIARVAKKKETLSRPFRDWRSIRGALGSAIWSVIAIASGGAVGGLALEVFHSTLLAPADFWQRLILGPPTFAVAVSIMLILYIGLRGRWLEEALREWWSRLGAWLLIYSLLWVGLFGVALYSPPFLDWLALHVKSLTALSFGWLATTISGLLASTSQKTGKRKTNRWLEVLAAVAPYVFILGLLAGLAWGINGILSPPAPLPPKTTAANSPAGVNVNVKTTGPSPVDVKVSPSPDRGQTLRKITAAHWKVMNKAHPGLKIEGQGLAWIRNAGSQARQCFNDALDGGPFGGNCRLLLLLVATAIVAVILGFRVDINAFSMHMMYRNRLARCYLGASNAGLRRAQPFTGFDQNDDIPLVALAGADWKCENAGPYPIINCSLNLVGGHELAWQQRKAASFVFTPNYCGYDFSDLPPGYCGTKAIAEGKPQAYAASQAPLTLATAMAISGAAASPNMGYHTSPAPAFLMTLFNVRLGWWIGNPRHRDGWSRSAPRWALGRLVAEMFGLTNAEGYYIYLSDGGHFENLGIFELVRRRCRFIIACDAEEDGDFEFSGLGNAIEKCRTDLGVSIELDVKAIRRRDEEGRSVWHCAVGSIRYDQTDPDAHAGTILYLKSSLTGDEPTDVQHYAARNAAFPHESTSDQWFGESQFESYRALGHHVARSAFRPVDEPEKLSGLTTERLFVDLAQRWYPPASAIDPAFKRRGETLNALYETLRKDSGLHFLGQQIYSGWRGLVEGLEDPPPLSTPPGPWLPTKYDELRAGFYFCNRLILLMEDVYHDLHLEQEYSHPDNRGWMNLFLHWGWSRMFRTTWTVSAANCGARFQNFCARHLGLQVGRMAVVEEDLKAVLDTKKQPSDSRLTYVEWQLLHSFFEESPSKGGHPELRTGAQLLRIELLPGQTPEEAAAAAEAKEPAFTAGFALLRPPAAREDGRKIIYFRVRDHMRRMGIARRAVYWLLAQDKTIDLDLRPMPETSLVLNDADAKASFEEIYRGVQIELEQNARKKSRTADNG